MFGKNAEFISIFTNFLCCWKKSDYFEFPLRYRLFYLWHFRWPCSLFSLRSLANSCNAFIVSALIRNNEHCWAKFCKMFLFFSQFIRYEPNLNFLFIHNYFGRSLAIASHHIKLVSHDRLLLILLYYYSFILFNAFIHIQYIYSLLKLKLKEQI